MGYAKAQAKLRAALATAARETVEHPFATIKARMGATHFLMKTLPKVATEMALGVRLSGRLSGYTPPPNLVGLSFRQTD
jgi:hypothetical protein